MFALRGSRLRAPAVLLQAFLQGRTFKAEAVSEAYYLASYVFSFRGWCGALRAASGTEISDAASPLHYSLSPAWPPPWLVLGLRARGY